MRHTPSHHTPTHRAHPGIRQLLVIVLGALGLLATTIAPASAEWLFPDKPIISIVGPSQYIPGTPTTVVVHSQLTWAGKVTSVALNPSNSACKSVSVGRLERDWGVFDTQFTLTCPANVTTVDVTGVEQVVLADNTTPTLSASATLTYVPSSSGQQLTATTTVSNRLLSNTVCAGTFPVVVTTNDKVTKAPVAGIPVTLTFTGSDQKITNYGTQTTGSTGQATFNVALAAGNITLTYAATGPYTPDSTPLLVQKVSVGPCTFTFRATSPIPTAVGIGDNVGLLTQIVATTNQGLDLDQPGQVANLIALPSTVGARDVAAAKPLAINTATTRDGGWVNLQLPINSPVTLWLTAGGTGTNIPFVATLAGKISTVVPAATLTTGATKAVADASDGRKQWEVSGAFTASSTAGIKAGPGVKGTLTLVSYYPMLQKWNLGTVTSGTDGTFKTVITPLASGTVTITYTRASALPAMTLPLGDVKQVAQVGLTATATTAALNVTATLTPPRGSAVEIQAAMVVPGQPLGYIGIGTITAGKAQTLSPLGKGTWSLRASFNGDDLGLAAYSKPVTFTIR